MSSGCSFPLGRPQHLLAWIVFVFCCCSTQETAGYVVVVPIQRPYKPVAITVNSNSILLSNSGVDNESTSSPLRPRRRRTTASTATTTGSNGKGAYARNTNNNKRVMSPRQVNNNETPNGWNRNHNNQQQQPPRSSYNNNNAWRMLNRRLVDCPNAQALLFLLQSTPNALTRKAAGGAMNMVNFSTAIHRLARHSLQQPTARAAVLKDPRLALLIAALAEAMLAFQKHDQQQPSSSSPYSTRPEEEEEEEDGHQQQPQQRRLVAAAPPPPPPPFVSRELSNTAWGLAKLRIVPPAAALPLQTTEEETCRAMAATALEVRKAILASAQEQQRQRKNNPNNDNNNLESTTPWVPLMSKLAGYILDYIRFQVPKIIQRPSSQKGVGTKGAFAAAGSGGIQQQEVANLLWAWATCGRGEEEIFGELVLVLIENQQQDQTVDSPGSSRSSPTLTPQEWSNSIWATATAGVHKNQDQLLQFVATAMKRDSGFVARFKPQEISNTLWGIATTLSNHKEDVTPLEQQAALDIERILIQAIVQNDDNQEQQSSSSLSVLQNFKTQELTNTIWSLATLGFGLELSEEQQEMNNYVVLPSDCRHDDRLLLQRILDAVVTRALQVLPLAKSQELNNMAWSLARLVGSGGNGGTANSGGDHNNNASKQRNTNIDALLFMIGNELSNVKRVVSSQDIGTSLWSFATLSYVNPTTYRKVAARLLHLNARNCKPQELSNTVWAIATAGAGAGGDDNNNNNNNNNNNVAVAAFEILQDRDAFDTTILHGTKLPTVRDPIVACFGMAAIQLMNRPWEFKTQEIKDILWSFSKVGIRHPQLFQSVAQHLVGRSRSGSNEEEEGDDNHDNDPLSSSSSSCRGLQDFSPQGIGNLAWAFARQAQLCEDAALRLKGSTRIANTNGRLAVYTTSYFDIGENLLQRLFLRIAETGLSIHYQLSILKPQDLSNTAWTFAILGLRHEAFTMAAKEQLQARLTAYLRGNINQWSTFKGQEIANLLWALATLNVPVGDLIDQVALYVEKVLNTNNQDDPVDPMTVAKHFKRQELANIAWSCAVFGSYPKSLMMNLYSGLLGKMNEGGREQQDGRDPKRMSEIYADGGLRAQEVMTLIYVQLALAQEGLDVQYNLSLPQGFPMEWQSGGTDRFAAIATSETATRPTDQYSYSSFDLLNLTTSGLQQMVSNAFNRIGFAHCQEHVISMNDLSEEYGISLRTRQLEVLSIDIANVDARIAIEVDGPAHFVCQIDQGLEQDGYTKVSKGGKLEYQFRWNGDTQLVNGPTALKRRLLQALGWKVISLPFWEWSKVDGNLQAEENYCKRLLESHL